MANSDPVNWMNRMVSEPYYLLHFLAFFSYIPVRCSVANVFSPLRSAHLLHREIQALLAFCVLVTIKVVKTESWEAFVADTLFYAKIFLGAIALMVDYHLALWYALAFSVIYIIAQQPAHGGLGTTSQLTPLQLESLLTEGSTSKFCMVEFRSLSTSACMRASSFFPKLSITFSNKNLSFVTVDLGLFPNAAEKFGIALGSLNQLPAYILFHDGAGISRLPEMDAEAKFFYSPVSKVSSRNPALFIFLSGKSQFIWCLPVVLLLAFLIFVHFNGCLLIPSNLYMLCFVYLDLDKVIIAV